MAKSTVLRMSDDFETYCLILVFQSWHANIKLDEKQTIIKAILRLNQSVQKNVLEAEMNVSWKKRQLQFKWKQAKMLVGTKSGIECHGKAALLTALPPSDRSVEHNSKQVPKEVTLLIMCNSTVFPPMSINLYILMPMISRRPKACSKT